MSKSGRINTKELIQKIESRVKEAVSKEGVVDLAALRELKSRKVPPSVLLIEDDESVRKALKRVLEDEGLNVRAAADGTQLATVLEAGPLDLMILDVGLPWINGIELAQLLKQHQDLRRIPLVFVSGQTGEADIRAAFAAGADDYIKKPFDIEHVKKTVRVLLQLNRRE